MLMPATPRKIVIWCPSGSFKEIQVRKLPEMINTHAAKAISIEAKPQMTGDSNAYVLGVERSLSRRSKRPTRRLKYLINHQFHAIEIYLLNDTEIEHMPQASTTRIQTADLLIIILDETGIVRYTPQPQQTTNEGNGGSDEMWLEYLRQQVKNTRYYTKYQKMLNENLISIQEIGSKKITPFVFSVYHAAIEKALNIHTNPDCEVVVLQASQMSEPVLITLQNYLEKINSGTNKPDHIKARFYRDTARVTSSIENRSIGEHEIIEVQGFVELFLNELALIEKKRIRREKLVRSLFGNDTARLYRPYERQTKVQKKNTRRVSR